MIMLLCGQIVDVGVQAVFILVEVDICLQQNQQSVR